MQRVHDWFRDTEGRGYPGAVVTVYDAGASTKPQLYSANGSIPNPLPIANPLSTDINGFYQFAVPNGVYDIQIEASGMPTTIIPGLSVNDLTPVAGPIAATNVSVTPSGTIASTNAQAALEELDADIVALDAEVATNDGLALHKAGAENITGAKTFVTQPIGLLDESIGVTDSFAGAVATDQGEVNSRRLSVASASDYADIQAALDYAATKVITNSNPDSQQAGGQTVFLPAGTYDIDDTLVVAPGVNLIGDGKTAAVLRNLTTNKTLVRNSVGAVYNAMGSTFENIALYGARTSNAQYGLDLLRPLNCTVRNVYIQNCGVSGLRIRQGISCLLQEVDSQLNVGAGIQLDIGAVSWADPTPNIYPTNNCTLDTCHGARNDGAGLLIQGAVNGTLVRGGAYENNYVAAGDNEGYNIEILGNTFSPNILDGVWVEGAVEAHVYQSQADISCPLKIIRLLHFGNGAAGNVDRAVILVHGFLHLEGAYGHGGAYKTISGSKSPFRINKALGDAQMRVVDAYGSTITDENFVEDETGAHTGLSAIVKQSNWGKWRQSFDIDSPLNVPMSLKDEAQSYPWFQADRTNHALGFSDPTTGTIDSLLPYRLSAGLLYTPHVLYGKFQVPGGTGAGINWVNNVVNGTVATTLGSVGPTGANAGDPLGWVRIQVGGVDRYQPYW